MYALSFGAQRLTAGRQDVDAGGATDYLLGKHGCRIDDVLTAVEHDQHLLVPQIGRQPGEHVLRVDRQPKCGSHGARDELGISQWCQVDEPDPVLVGTNGRWRLDRRLGARGLAPASNASSGRATNADEWEFARGLELDLERVRRWCARSPGMRGLVQQPQRRRTGGSPLLASQRSLPKPGRCTSLRAYQPTF
jgi:hypothetical protein